ncbi:MAG: PD-(D/E)XK nuclease family protein [PVC group bacterium]
MNYSHTRISTFENCPLQYKYKYRDRLTPTLGTTIEAFMGSCVHEALETLYRDLLMTRCPSLEELLDLYEVVWEKAWEKSIRVIKKEYSPADYRRKGRKCVDDYYRRYHPFAGGRTIGIEERVRIDLGRGRTLSGFIDRLDLRDGGIYEIHDYKTSSSLPPQEAVDRDRQLALYQLGIEKRWNDVAEVILIWHYLVFDRELCSTRSPGDLEELLVRTNKIIDRIESTVEFEPKRSALCDWCEFKNICPLWKHQFHLEELPPRALKEDDGRTLVDRYAGLLAEEHTLKEEKDRVRDAVIEYCAAFGYEVVFGTDRKIHIRRTKELHFPPAKDERRKELERLIEEAGRWRELSSLNIVKLTKALQLGKLPAPLSEQVAPFYTEEEACRLSISPIKRKE